MAKKTHPETLAIRGFKEQTTYNEHNQALFLTSSFTYPDCETAESLFLGEREGYTYSRTANPTVTTFAKRVAILEGAEAAQATATGMAAIQATFLSFLKKGDHLVASHSIFGTAIGLINSLINFGIEVTYVPLIDLNHWKEAIKPNTKMFFFETPSNPLGEVVDIAKLSDIAHAHDIMVVVDNSFCSPVLQRPIEFGADISIQSATKLIDGQGRVFGGVVSGSQRLINEVFTHVKTAGQVLSPFNAWVLISGLETMFVRVERQCQSALSLATWLENQPKVEEVFYPGLTSHPQYALVQKQQKAGGIVLSFKVQGGREEAWKLVNNVQLFSTTGNFGDVRSIITHPFTTTHCKVAPEIKIESGITENLLRISVGLEHLDDLKEDLEETLKLI